MTSVHLPDAWQARDRDGFDTFFSDAAQAPGIDPEYVAALAADTKPIIDDAAARGLVLLAGLFESLDAEPVELDPDLPVPFGMEDVAPTAIAASLALLEQPRPRGSAAHLQAALERAEARWLTPPAVLELPSGPAVLTREVQSVHPVTLKHPVDVLAVTYYLLPDAEPDMIITALFRTPSLGFASEFDEQFAAIAARIEIVDVDRTDDRA